MNSKNLFTVTVVFADLYRIYLLNLMRIILKLLQKSSPLYSAGDSTFVYPYRGIHDSYTH